ncbi:hypothetical protein EIP91_012361 [Steccherinum ochraceum]|uniref:Uncharacterized protein n=1 Tax=Steccherinum ochraceum TaxID=92696 RepID=A0A4R0RWZ6_9APHY|nr:hypothetical protein EIP91_012361 [Steccherinum ochraceum]
MSNSTHKKKASSSRHKSQRLEAATKATSHQSHKKAATARRKTISRTRLADMTAELDGQFAETMYFGPQAPQPGSSWQPRPQMKSLDDPLKDLTEVLDAL